MTLSNHEPTGRAPTIIITRLTVNAPLCISPVWSLSPSVTQRDIREGLPVITADLRRRSKTQRSKVKTSLLESDDLRKCFQKKLFCLTNSLETLKSETFEKNKRLSFFLINNLNKNFPVLFYCNFRHHITHWASLQRLLQTAELFTYFSHGNSFSTWFLLWEALMLLIKCHKWLKPFERVHDGVLSKKKV